LITKENNLKKNTAINYEVILSKFCSQIGDRDLESITPEEILSFLTTINQNLKHSTKRLRYILLKAFFNFAKNTLSLDIKNPCDAPTLKKIFRNRQQVQWTILDKDIVDEIIFKSTNLRNRIILELMARGGLRIGEVLKIRPKDVDERRITLVDPKSGNASEVAYIPQKVAVRLQEYIRTKNIESNVRMFPITYTGARAVIKRAAAAVGVSISPHDLRRHAATYASRSGAPIEIVSKVILRHSNLSTTQRYLGKVSDAEAVRWIENLYG